MERLTEYYDNIDGIKFPKLKYGDCRDAIERLAKYEDLEEAGLLKQLPCKIGEKVYNVINGEIIEDDVTGFMITPYLAIQTSKNTFWLIYKENVFLTKEEAEKALEEMSKN